VDADESGLAEHGSPGAHAGSGEAKPTVEGQGAPRTSTEDDAAGQRSPNPNPKPAPKKPTPEEARAVGSSIRDLLDAGRVAVRKKDYATGIAKYEAALALDPVEPRLLGELGWALFLDGRLEEARARLYDALIYNRDNDSRGAILYNLGRVAEAQQQRPTAIEFYRRSLALRTNDVVRARLESLGAGDEASEHPGCAFEPRKAEWTFDLCAAYVKEIGTGTCDANDLAETPVVVDAAGTPMGGEKQTRLLAEFPGDWTLHVFRVEHQEDWTTEIVLAVVRDRTWWTSVIAVESNPGVGYVSESAWVQATKQLDPSAAHGLGLLLQWSHDANDGDYMINELETLSQAYESLLVLPAADAGATAPPEWKVTVRTRFEWGIDRFLEDVDPPDVRHSEGFGKKRTLRSEARWLGATEEVEIRVLPDTPTASPVGKFTWADYPIRCPHETVFYGD